MPADAHGDFRTTPRVVDGIGNEIADQFTDKERLGENCRFALAFETEIDAGVRRAWHEIGGHVLRDGHQVYRGKIMFFARTRCIDIGHAQQLGEDVFGMGHRSAALARRRLRVFETCGAGGKRKLGADDGKRRAQLMAGITGEMPERIERRLQPHHEGIDRFHQIFHLHRHGLPDWMQVVGAALGNRFAEPVKRPERNRHRDPDNDRRAHDHEQQAQGRAQDDGLRKLAAGDRRFSHRHGKGHGIDAGGSKTADRGDADRLVKKHCIAIGRRFSGRILHRRQVLVTGEKLPVWPVDTVKHPVLRRRCQHFQRDIGNIDLQRAVFGHHHPLGNRKRGT